MINNKRLFLETLKEMKGKTFMYGKHTLTLLNYSIDEAREKVHIKTDKKDYEKSYDSVSEFLTYWEPVVEAEQEEEEAQDNGLALTVYEEQTNLAKDLISILKENITKVQKDKNYIPQAQAINANVNSIISVTRLQLDVHRQLKSGRKK